MYKLLTLYVPEINSTIKGTGLYYVLIYYPVFTEYVPGTHVSAW